MDGLNILSHKIGRSVAKGEISGFTLTEGSLPPPPEGDVESSPSLQSLKLSQEIQNKALEKAEYDLFADINLRIEYRTSGYDPDMATAFDYGYLKPGKNKRALVASVNLTVPLDWQQERAEVELQRSRARLLEAEYDSNKVRLTKIKEGALFRLTKLKQNIAFAKKRETLAQRALKDYNEFYLRGRADLDQLIRAEEDLIGTQRDLARYISSQGNLHLLLGALRGKLRGYLSQTY